MAIAFDAATDGGNNGGVGASLTFTHSFVGSSNTILWVPVVGDTSVDDVTGVTFNSVSLTQLGTSFLAPGSLRYSYLYYGLGLSGSHSVVVSASTAHYLIAGAISYTGVRQSGQPSANNSTTSTGTPADFTTSLTTVDDNSWVGLGCYTYQNSNTVSAGAGATRRVLDGAFCTWAWFDTNGVVTPAGSKSMTVHCDNGGGYANLTDLMVAMSPPGSTSKVPWPLFHRMVAS